MSLPIITDIPERYSFLELLKSNPGLFFIKFGAEWCGPCKTINAGVKNYFDQMPPTVQCAIIDIDKNMDLYLFLKSKRIINGVPAILCYKKENNSHVPDDLIIGANKKEINDFFMRLLTTR